MKKLITIILDGFGIKDENHGNAVKQANMPVFNKFWDENPHCLLYASEKYVGLPNGQFGNSEVGHLTIGAGRLVKQASLEIDELFKEKKLDDNKYFKEIIEHLKKYDGALHLMGIASNGGVHGEISYFLEMLKVAKRCDIKNVYLHLITDGRDTSPTSSPMFIKYIMEALEYTGIGKIASVCGRYYAMDRDNKWDRTKIYYDAIIRNIGLKSNDIISTIKNYYSENITDEFIPPVICDDKGIIKENDCLFWLNYRSDRARQIMSSLSNPNFTDFLSKKDLNLKIMSFYPISKTVLTHNIFKEQLIENPLGIYLSKLGMTQARVAETEKYSHVTSFFDGSYDGNIDGCDKFLIPSPKVATYDLKPEMSAVGVTKQAVKCMESDYDFILINFANPDMVGHTGKLEPTIKALEAVDKCLSYILEKGEENFYEVIILSDHGNADTMLDKNDNPITTHSIAKVPFVINDSNVKLVDGDLTNVAPTILKYLDIKLPEEMQKTKTLFVEE